MRFRFVKAEPFILSITILILSAYFYGCSPTTSLAKEKTAPAISGGAIMVDSPEVFTRQRLLDQHQQEVEWLSQKLNEYTPGGYQGIRDVRILATETQIALAEIKHDVAELEKEVENLEEEISEKQEETQQKAKEQPSEKSSAEPTVPPAGLLSPQMVAKTEAELTHIETVRDEMAYRQMIHAALSAIEVNDTNELMGYTLYTLKFDVTIVPGTNTNSLGEVSLKLGWGSEISEFFFEKWRMNLQQIMENDAFILQRRWITGNLTNKEKIYLHRGATQLIKTEQQKTSRLQQKIQSLEEQRRQLTAEIRANEAQLDKIEQEIKAIDEQISSLPDKKSSIKRINLNRKKSSAKRKFKKIENNIAELKVKESEVGQNLRQLSKAIGNRETETKKIFKFTADVARENFGINENNQLILSEIIGNRYKKYLSEIITFLEPHRVIIDGIPSYFPEIDVNSPAKIEKKQREILAAKLQQLKLEPYIHSIEPKEYVQNLSNTMAKEENISGGSKKRFQTIVQSVQRRPLAVGYTKGKNEFGWILGPKIHITRKGEFTLRHTPVQHSFQVTIVVPAWVDAISLTGKYFWLDDDGQTGTESDLWKEKMDVRLPADPSVITSVLVKDQSRYKPIISSPWRSHDKDNKILVHAGEETTLLIRGWDLWRSPKVFIGG
jgi:septal ring factor EnvC (AmiA/AmiB activator)